MAIDYLTFNFGLSKISHILLSFQLHQSAISPSFLDGRDRNRALNGSTRSLASTHPMLAGTTSATAAPGTGYGGHYGGQSPVGETLRHHLTSEGASLSSKVHTVILSGNNWGFPMTNIFFKSAQDLSWKSFGLPRAYFLFLSIYNRGRIRRSGV